MHCKNCGKKIPPDDSLCPNCGAPVKSLPVKFKTTEVDKKKNKIKIKQEKAKKEKSKIDNIFLSKKRKKNRRSKIIGSLFVIFGFSLLACFIFLVIKILIKPHNSAYLVPKDSNIYVSINIQEKHPQIKTLKKLSKKIADSKETDQYIQDIIKKIINEEEFNFKQDIKPWAGNELALIWLQDEEKSEVILIESNNKNETQKSLNNLFQKSNEKSIYQQIEITTVGETYYAQIDNYLTASHSKDNIKKIIDVKKNKNQSLAKDTTFNKVKSNLSEKNLLFAYFNIKEILKQTKSNTIYNLDFLLNQQLLDTVESYGTILTANDNGIKFKGYLYADENNIKKLKRTFKNENFESTLINFVPSSSIFYAEKKNFENYIQDFQEDLTKSDPIFKNYLDNFKNSLKEQYNIDIDEDIFSWMNLNCALIFTPNIKNEENSELSFDFSVIFDLKDKNDVFEKMEKIKNIIQEQENISKEEIQTYKYILGNKIGEQLEEEEIFSFNIPEYPDFTFNYVFIENKLIISSSHQAISSILKVIKESNKNLSSDTTFSKTISELPKKNNGLFYMNNQNLIDIINFDDYQIDDIYIPYLKSIKSLGFTSESSENEIINYGFLLIE